MVEQLETARLTAEVESLEAELRLERSRANFFANMVSALVLEDRPVYSRGRSQGYEVDPVMFPDFCLRYAEIFSESGVWVEPNFTESNIGGERQTRLWVTLYFPSAEVEQETIKRMRGRDHGNSSKEKQGAACARSI